VCKKDTVVEAGDLVLDSLVVVELKVRTAGMELEKGPD